MTGQAESRGMGRAYCLLDVFTDRVLAGNPLAVVLGGDGLSPAAMQAIAAEFNLSETAFVLPPAASDHRARFRIFTPASELPFAGHPTVGTAVCLALLDPGADPARFVLEVEAGLIRCEATAEGGRSGYASFALPVLPERIETALDPALVAGTLGLLPDALGFDDHLVGVWSAGVPFLLVPLRDGEAVRRAAVAASLWPDLEARAGTHGVFVYCRECVDPAHQVHARMFAPGLGIAEDPATGAAVAALAGQIVAFDKPADGKHRIMVEQGYEMGRPSLISLELTTAQGRLAGASLGGQAVLVGQGRLFV